MDIVLLLIKLVVFAGNNHVRSERWLKIGAWFVVIVAIGFVVKTAPTLWTLTPAATEYPGTPAAALPAYANTYMMQLRVVVWTMGGVLLGLALLARMDVYRKYRNLSERDYFRIVGSSIVWNYVSRLSHLDQSHLRIILSTYPHLMRSAVNAGSVWTETDGLHAVSLDISSAVAGLGLPKVVPLVFCDDEGVEDPLRIVDVFSKYLSGGTRLGLLWVMGDPGRFDWQQLQRRLREAYAHETILLDRNQLNPLLFERPSSDYLRSLILRSVSLKTISPFEITGPASSGMFFGRETILRQITQGVKNSSFAVVGGRRIGKTSLLQRLFRDRLPITGFQVVYHDCSTTPEYNQFLAAPISEWVNRGVDRRTDSTLGELLEHGSPTSNLVLLLDEADKLLPYERDNNWRLTNRLRAMANRGSLQVVLSGERTLRSALRDPTSPLFNFADEILLGPLDEQSASELITSPMHVLEVSLEDEAEIIQKIIEFTSCHPNVIQRLCMRLMRRLTDNRARVITDLDVNAIIEDPNFLREDFLSTYWESSTPLEKLITLVMAEKGGHTTATEMRETLLTRCDLVIGTDKIDEALQNLMDLRSLLRNDKSGYSFAVPAFPKVLRNTGTIDDLIEVLIQQIRSA